MYKYLILDFGYVLAYPKTGDWFKPPILYSVMDMDLVDMKLLDKKLSEYHDIVSSKVVSLEEECDMWYLYYDSVLSQINYPLYDKNIASDIAYNLTYCSDKYGFYNHVKEDLLRLRQKYKLIMLTDNWPCVVGIMKEMDIYDLFDKVYVSSIYGEEKKDGNFFLYPINDFNIQESEGLFVDDNRELLDVALRYGLDVRLMDREKRVKKKTKYRVIHDLGSL